MNYTIASFLREKASNMATWLAENGHVCSLPHVSDVAIVAMAQTLHDKYKATIEARDFDALLAEKENLPTDVLCIVLFVQIREPLHDKFWRYLHLFSDTVSSHE